MHGKELDLLTVISLKEMFGSITRNLHFINVAKLLRLSIQYFACYMPRQIQLEHSEACHGITILSS